MDKRVNTIVNKIAAKWGVDEATLKKAVGKANVRKSGVERPVAKVRPNPRSSEIATTSAKAKAIPIPIVEAGAVAEVLAKVQSYKLRNHLIEFDDMLDLAVELLVCNPEVTDTVSAQIEHLLVDELQDISSKEVSLIYDLAKRVRSTLLVGDKKQAIYKFRGADIKCWDELESRLIKRFGPRSRTRSRLKLELDLKYYCLTKSHRLPEQAIPLVNSVGADICDDPLLTSDKQGCVPRLKIATSNDQQSAFVATVIKKLLAKGVDAKEIAILGRTKKTLNSMKSHLSHLLSQDNDSVDTEEKYRKSRATSEKVLSRCPKITCTTLY